MEARKVESKVKLEMTRNRIKPKVNRSTIGENRMSNTRMKAIAIDSSYMDKAVKN
jgi:hypothetical protein